MGTLGFERGVATLAQQIGFGRELDAVIAAARRDRRGRRPEIAGAARRRLDRAAGDALPGAALAQ